jgi:hypothetical protein
MKSKRKQERLDNDTISVYMSENKVSSNLWVRVHNYLNFVNKYENKVKKDKE